MKHPAPPPHGWGRGSIAERRWRIEHAVLIRLGWHPDIICAIIQVYRVSRKNTAMSIPKTSGIYQFLCTVNGKVYVGSAINLYERHYNHMNELSRGVHHNQLLQRAWAKYGSHAFVFSVLELTSPDALIEREQYWLDVTECCNRDKGYNILAKARSGLGMKMPEGNADRLRARFSKTWEGFIDPDGNPVAPITNLRAFCAERGLTPSAMQQLAHGHKWFQSHKGWTHRDSPPRTPYTGSKPGTNAIVWEGFIDPDGDEVGPIENLTAFCREHGLEFANMRALAHGKRQSHRGWSHKNAAPYKTKPHKGRY